MKDPKDYRWSGYGEAMGGNRTAREGVCLIEHHDTWRKAAASYRRLLYRKGAEPGRSDKRAIDPKGIRKVVQNGGQVSEAEALRLKLRYFTEGVVLGSEAFVNQIYAEFRDRFSQKAADRGTKDAAPTVYGGVGLNRR